MTKKICYIDMDGVLADFELSLYTMFPHLIDIEKGSPELNKAVDEVCVNEGKRIFRDLKPMTYAKEAFAILCEHYDVYILSTPMWLVPESWTDKRLWAAEMFGSLVHKKIILSHNKGLCQGDYLIDDRIKNGVENFKGEHIHFGQEKFEDWHKILKYLSDKDGWK